MDYLEQEDTKPPAKTKNTNLIIGIVAVIVVIFIIIAAKTSAPTEPVDQAAPANGVDISVSETEPATVSFRGIISKGWPNYDRAVTNIQTLGPNQTINDYVIEDPTDEALAYFVTTADTAVRGETLVSIYRYQTADDTFERLFRTRYGAGAFPYLGSEVKQPAVHAVGYDSGKLILFVTDADAPEDPCTEPLAEGMAEATRGATTNLLSFDLADPNAGFAEYDAPEDAYTAARDRREACLSSGNEAEEE